MASALSVSTERHLKFRLTDEVRLVEYMKEYLFLPYFVAFLIIIVKNHRFQNTLKLVFCIDPSSIQFVATVATEVNKLAHQHVLIDMSVIGTATIHSDCTVNGCNWQSFCQDSFA